MTHRDVNSSSRSDKYVDYIPLSKRRGISPPPFGRDRPRRGTASTLHGYKRRAPSPPSRRSGRTRECSPLHRARSRGGSPLIHREIMRKESPLMNRDGIREERLRRHSPATIRESMKGERRDHSPFRRAVRGDDYDGNHRQSLHRTYHSRSPRRGNEGYLPLGSSGMLNSILEPHQRERQLAREALIEPSILMPSLTSSQGITDTFPADQSGRHLAETLMSRNRNEMIDMPLPPPRFSEIKLEGSMTVQESKVNETSINSMLVPRSIILDDGTVGTFYSLPSEPTLNSLSSRSDNMLNAAVYHSYAETVPGFIGSADLRYAAEVPKTREPSGDGLIVERRVVDERIVDQNAFAIGNGGLSVWAERGNLELPINQRSSSMRPDVMDIRSESRLRSPFRDNSRRFNGDGRGMFVSEVDRAVQVLGDNQREHFVELDNRTQGGEGTRSSALRMGGTDYMENVQNEELLSRITTYEDKYTKELRNFMPHERSENPLYDHIKAGVMRQIRSPRRKVSDVPHTRDLSIRNGPTFTSENRASPRRSIGCQSPRRGRSLAPPALRHEAQMDLHEFERRQWKRKRADAKDDFTDQVRPLEAEFSRQGRERTAPERDWHGRRASDWDRLPVGYPDRMPDKQYEEFPHGNNFISRPMIDREGYSKQLRRYSPWHEDNPRRNASKDWNEYMHTWSKSSRVKHDSMPLSDRSRVPLKSDMKNDGQQGTIDEHVIVADLPEDSLEFQQQVHRAFMKYVKILNENPQKRRIYEEQGKDEPLLCLVCGSLSRRFLDTQSLVVHTFMSQKKGMRANHLGLHKAICTMMGWGYEIEPSTGKSPGKAYQLISDEEAKMNKDDLILWPPVVVVQDVCTFTSMDGQDQEGAAEVTVREFF